MNKVEKYGQTIEGCHDYEIEEVKKVLVEQMKQMFEAHNISKVSDYMFHEDLMLDNGKYKVSVEVKGLKTEPYSLYQ